VPKKCKKSAQEYETRDEVENKGREIFGLGRKVMEQVDRRSKKKDGTAASNYTKTGCTDITNFNYKK